MTKVLRLEQWQHLHERIGYLEALAAQAAYDLEQLERAVLRVQPDGLEMLQDEVRFIQATREEM